MTVEVKSPEIWNCLESIKDLNAIEESATFWLWAYPVLIGWPNKFEWLFSPVVGNVMYPGDLWGIDEAGNLLLIETKRGKRSDPFEDFIQFQKHKKWETTASEQHLLTKWGKLYASEKAFMEKYKMDLNNRAFSGTKAEGVVPYSSKRLATRIWPILYTNVIAPHLFEGQHYTECIRQYIRTRAQSGENNIYYFGMVLVENPGSYLLSLKGVNHFHELVSLAGSSKVFLKSITAHVSETAQCVTLQCCG